MAMLLLSPRVMLAWPPNSEIGATYGIAFDKLQQTVYVGAFVKRKAKQGALGNESTGAIYKIANPESATPTKTLYADLNTIFPNSTGANPHPIATTDFLDDTLTIATVYKRGLGDLEMSTDYKKIYAVSLFNKKLYEIPTTGALNNTTIKPYDIPTSNMPIAGKSGQSCPAVDVRPFGLGKDKAGNIYIGGVCTAETSKDTTDLTAYIWKFDGTTVTLMKNFSLAYQRGVNSKGLNKRFVPWNNITTRENNPMPIISDIEFDVNGDMIVGVKDRFGDITPVAFNTGQAPFFPRTAGDILRLCKNSSGGFDLENGGSCGSITTAGTPTFPQPKAGPGGNEYYFEDIPGDADSEAAQGALLLLPGSGEVVSTAYDPVTFKSDGTKLSNVYTGGIQKYSNTTGRMTGAYDVYLRADANTFAKAGGLGDIEALCKIAPIEIGNRVWYDKDNDGIQDAGEVGIGGVKVDLCLASAPNTPVATATTDANGTYYFSSATGTGSGSAKFGVNLKFETDYILKFPTTKDTLTVSTVKDAGGNDLLDTDADAAGKITFKTGTAGQNNHSFDVAYTACTPPTRVVRAFNPTCTAPGRLQLVSTDGDKYGISKGGTYTGPNYGVATAKPGTLPANIKTAISGPADSTFTVRVFNKTNDCFRDTTITVKAAPAKPTITLKSGFPACREAGTKYTIKFTATGGTVTTVPNLTVTGDSISVPIATASVKLIITSAGGCKDSVTVAAPVCDKPVGSLGDFVWKDLNDNGKQDSGEPGVNGVKVILYAANNAGQPGAKLDSITTANGGKYNFPNLAKGDYLVQVVLSTVPDSCRISDKQNQAGVADSLDNDFNNGGFSDVVKLDPALGGLSKDNPTIDAALVSKKVACVKPDAGKDSTYACVNNQLPATLQLKTAQQGQKYKILGNVPPGANVSVSSPDGLVTGTITAGTYNFVLQTQSDSVNCRDTVKIVVQPCVVDCVKPDAGKDSALVCTGTTQPTSIDLKDAKAGEKWKVLTFPTPTAGSFGVKITTPAGLVTPNAPATSLIPGTYQFVLQNQSDSLKCRDTISVVVPNCTPAPCVRPVIGVITTTPATCANGTPNSNAAFTVGGISGGDKFSTATTLAGLAPYATATALTGGTISRSSLPNPASPSGQTYFVRVYNGKTDCFRDTTLTLTFNDCGGGPCLTLTERGDGRDTLCSGIYFGASMLVKVGGTSPVKFVRFTSPQTGSAAYTGGTLLATVTPGSSDSLAALTFDNASQFPANNGAAPVSYYVYAIAASTAGLPANCRPSAQKVFTVLPLPEFAQTTEPICADSTTYAVKVTLPAAGTFKVTLARAIAGIEPGAGFFPTDIIETKAGATGSTTFTLAVADSNAIVFVENETTGCDNNAPVAKPRFTDCGQTYDLTLDKSIDKKLAMLGETVNYTIRVWNEGQGNATGVEVTDSLNAGVRYVTHATAAGTYNPTTKIWTIGNLAKGDTVTLSVAVKVVAQGVWFNTAEITKMNEKDEDSTPGNGKEGEDDIDRECFTVPVMVCRGQGTSITMNVPAEYTGVVWLRKTQGGQPVKVAEGNSFTATETALGTYEYTFTSTSGTCPAEGCCPTIIVVEDCCPADVCVPFVITKKVK